MILNIKFYPHPVTEGIRAIFYPTAIIAPESIVIELEWDFRDGEKINAS